MSETDPLTKSENGVDTFKLEREDLGFDYVFLRLPQVSGKQIAWFLLVNYCWVVAGFVQVGSVILQAIPDYRCKTPADENFNLNYEAGTEFTPSTDPCLQYQGLENICTEFNDDFPAYYACFSEKKPSLQTEACNAGYIFDNSTFTRTVSTEYELVCENKELESAISAIFMSGLFFGVFIFGPLMDKIGRKLSAMIAMFGISAASLPLVLIPYHENGVWTYAALRWLSGFFSISAGTASFVWTMEIVGPKYRTWFGSLTQGIFSFGYMLLSLIGYLLSDWQDQMIVILLAPLLYIPIYLFLPTSIAWLFSSRKYDRARVETKKIAASLNVNDCSESFLDKVEASVKLQQKSGDGKVYTQIDLFKPPRMRIVTIVEMYQWFATTLVYYGLSLGAGDLGGSLLMTNFINGAVEVICYILLPLFIDHPKIGRVWGTVWTMGLGSLGCILTAVFDFLLIDDSSNDGYATAKMICAVVGKFGVAGTFGIVYVHASEMYPTPVRGVGVGLSSAGGRIGGILAPIINGLGKTTSWLPFVIFGALGIVQVLTVFFLPETLGVPMLTTIEEAEEFFANPKTFLNTNEESGETKSRTSSLSSSASARKVSLQETVEF